METPYKYTNNKINSQEIQVLLERYFISQSASGIHKKIQKQARSPRASINELLNLALRSSTAREK